MTRGPLYRMSPHRVMLMNALGGAGLGLLFMLGLLVIDASGLRDLIWRDADGVSNFLILCAGFALTSASLVAGSAMLLHASNSHDDDDDNRGGPDRGELIPIRVKARR